ncbi:MAG: hypothetical protein L6Q76_04365 [Polyangiaceae bacterium]|nr:hypothetical protein [Polyangiaceae bacterium]
MVEAAPFEGRICANSPSPRAAAVATLAAEFARLSAAGDLEGARILTETIARLLGSVASGAAVVDRGAERARRGL